MAGPNGDYRPKARAELQRKLRLACQLEVEIGEEVDRLLSLAFEQGWNDGQIADASPHLTIDAVRQARVRGGHRLPPIFCKGCDTLIPRTGRRGKPRSWCTGCRP